MAKYWRLCSVMAAYACKFCSHVSNYSFKFCTQVAAFTTIFCTRLAILSVVSYFQTSFELGFHLFPEKRIELHCKEITGSSYAAQLFCIITNIFLKATRMQFCMRLATKRQRHCMHVAASCKQICMRLAATHTRPFCSVAASRMQIEPRWPPHACKFTYFFRFCMRVAATWVQFATGWRLNGR